jgi:hypothetical protein
MLHKLCGKLEQAHEEDKTATKVRRFTPHDLRSTARSHLAALGVHVIVAERCLNHTLGGLIAVYDQHDYMTERRAALELGRFHPSLRGWPRMDAKGGERGSATIHSGLNGCRA